MYRCITWVLVFDKVKLYIPDKTGGKLYKNTCCHSPPSSDSLTVNTTKRFVAGLSEADYEFEIVDLYAKKCSPLI